MTAQNGILNLPIRYSEAFKMEIVRELETTDCTFGHLQSKYRIRGAGTVKRWVTRYGSGKRGKIIRVEKPEEVNELARLRRELRTMKEALADAHVGWALEKAYLEVACQRMGQSVESFKKKNAGGRRTGR